MRHCVFLLIAGVLDAAFTQLGITEGIVEEGNPIMKFVIDKNWSYFYLMKILLPVVLIYLFYLRPLTGWVKTLLVSTSFIYGTILLFHISWVILIFIIT